VSSRSVVIHRFKVLSLSLGQRHPSHPPLLPPLVTTGRRRSRRTTRLGTTSKRVFIFIFILFKKKERKERNNTHPSCALFFTWHPSSHLNPSNFTSITQ
jgi:hypothetical protein